MSIISAPATPSTILTYDAAYGDMISMTDAAGTTTYANKPVGVFGAKLVASVDGPGLNDTVTYDYDEVGRVTSRSIDGVATSYTYDALDRVISEVQPAGTFTFTYEGATNRPLLRTYPNGQTAMYSYFGLTADKRLQTLHHQKPGGATIARFDYTYDVVGNITTWRQEIDGEDAVEWAYAYDSVSQLVAATKSTATGGPAAILLSEAYTYDAVGNLLTTQRGEEVLSGTFDSVNRLAQLTPGGPVRLVGTINEPATVTIGTTPTRVDGSGRFEGLVSVVPGTNLLEIFATDPSANTSVKRYEVDATGASTSFTYDANGNLISDGTRTFEWDAKNRMTAIVVGGTRTTLTYDGQSRVRSIRDEVSGSTTRLVELLWCGTTICAGRRDGVAEEYGRHTLRSGGSSVFLTGDHLGSIWTASNASAATTAAYSYSAFGARTKRPGDSVDVPFGFTGHLMERDLMVTLYRAYDPKMARWLSRDPLGLRASDNLYGYVNNMPLTRTDPLGLAPVCVGCTPEDAGQIADGNRAVCRNIVGNQSCRDILNDNKMYECFQRYACLIDYKVVCDYKPRTIDCAQTTMGGNGGFMTLFPNALMPYYDDPKCGPTGNTMAHELSHFCGVGPDNDDPKHPYPPYQANRKLADAIGTTCSAGAR